MAKFIQRDIDINNKPRVVDAQKLITYFLSLDRENVLIPNSPLYNLAVKQYNSTVKNKTTRPNVPEWFCGRVDPVTNELAPRVDDITTRASAGFTLDPIIDTDQQDGAEIARYPNDECLNLGLPGSYDYAQCSDSLSLEVLETSGVDWIASIAIKREEEIAEPIEFTGGGTSDSFWDEVGDFFGEIGSTAESFVDEVGDFFGSIF